MHVHDDIELMERIARQDQTALTELYQKHSGVVYGIAMRVLQNAVWAEEAMQDTFIKVWREPHKWNPEAGRLINWLATVTRYTAIDRLRKERRQPPLSPASLDDLPNLTSNVGTVGDVFWQNSELLRSLLLQLPPAQAEVIQLSFWQGMTYDEISRQLSLPLGTVKSRLQLGLQKLRVLVGDSQAAQRS